MIEILIDTIGRQEAASKKVIGPLMHVLNKCPDFSGNMGLITEEDLLSALPKGKILAISRKESAEKIEIIGAVLVLEEDKSNEFGKLALAFDSSIRVETIKKCLLKIRDFFYSRKGWSKLSVLTTDREETSAIFDETGFIMEANLQLAIKTIEGYKKALIYSAIMNGRGGAELISLTAKALENGRIEAELSEVKTNLLNKLKEKEIALHEANTEKLSLEKQIKAQEEKLKAANNEIEQKIREIKDLQTALQNPDETEKDQIIEKLTEQVTALETDLKNKKSDDTGTDANKEEDEKITELKGIIRQLGNQNKELSILVGEKSIRIVNQAKIIEQNSKIISQLKEKSGIQHVSSEDEPLQEEVSVGEIESSKEHEIREGSQELKPCEEPDPSGVKDPTPVIKPASDSDQKIEPAEKPEELKLNKTQKLVLEIAIRNPEGIAHKVLRTKIPRNPEERDSTFQVRVSSAIVFLEKKKLITNDKIGTEKLVKPIMDNIAQQFPEMIPTTNIQENSGLEKPEIEESTGEMQTKDISLQEPEKINDSQPEIKVAANLSEYGIVISMLEDHKVKGINATQLCEEARDRKAIPFDTAKAVLNNLNRQKRLRIVVPADNLMNSIIALKS